MKLVNIDTGKSETIDPRDAHATAKAAKRIASTTGQNPADVAADAEMIGSSILYSRTTSAEFADAMNALSLDLTD